MGKHTPGPWLVEGATVYALNGESFPVNRFTARIDAGWESESERASIEEAYATARLIATAPELLEEIQEFVDISREIIGALLAAGGTRNLILADRINRRHPQRHRLIAKATGEQP